MATLDYRKITEDLDYYAKAFETFSSRFGKGDSLTGWHETLLGHENIRNIIAGLKEQEPLRILDVGSGPGEDDGQLIRQLLTKHPVIHTTVVEPGSEHIQRYQSLASKGDLKTVTWDWRQQTWQEYLKYRESSSDASKFHVVIAIHVLYYLGDFEQAILDLMSCVEDGGLLIIMLVRGDSEFTRISELIVDNPHVEINSCNVKKVMEKHQIQSREVRTPLHIEVTDCFGDDDETARHLIDFISHVLHFRETAPPAVFSNFMETLASPEYSTKKENGTFLDAECGTIIAVK